MTEVESFLTKIRSSIIDAAKEFWRWRDGTCLFCEESKGMNEELIQNYTFKEPVNENPIILRVFYQIAEIQKKCSDKVYTFKEMWEDDND